MFETHLFIKLKCLTHVPEFPFMSFSYSFCKNFGTPNDKT